MRVAVVGAGIMGAATAYSLSRRGHPVTIYEARAEGHQLGSSHGRSRIVRRAYPDPFYTSLMSEAYPLWRAICPIEEGGLAFFGSESDPEVESMIAALDEHEVRYELRRELEGIRLAPSELAVFVAEAGWVAADRARRAFLDRSRAEIRRERIQDPTQLDFDAVILTVGPWIRQFVPDLAVETCVQTFAYLENAPDYPFVWIESGPHGLYGFPAEVPGQRRIKFGVHRPGIPIDPDHPVREPDPAALALLMDFAMRRFGHFGPVLTEATACLYTNTADHDFRWGELAPGIFWVSPCSGHGFKFAPWIGERLADFAEGARHPREWPRFSPKG